MSKVDGPPKLLIPAAAPKPGVINPTGLFGGPHFVPKTLINDAEKVKELEKAGVKVDALTSAIAGTVTVEKPKSVVPHIRDEFTNVSENGNGEATFLTSGPGGPGETKRESKGGSKLSASITKLKKKAATDKSLGDGSGRNTGSD